MPFFLDSHPGLPFGPVPAGDRLAAALVGLRLPGLRVHRATERDAGGLWVYCVALRGDDGTAYVTQAVSDELLADPAFPAFIAGRLRDALTATMERVTVEGA